MPIDMKIAFVNEKQINLLVAPQIINNETLISLQFVAESTNSEFRINSETGNITIITSGTNPRHLNVVNLIFEEEEAHEQSNGLYAD